MKRNFNYISILAVAAVLSGCSQTDAWEGASRKPVKLTVSSIGMTGENGGATRAADGQYTATTGFSGTEQVEVFMKGTETTSAVYSVGEPDANKKSALTAVSEAEALTYPLTGDVTLYGVYPSTSTASHVVRHDQTSTTDGNANYKQSDLMYAKTIVTQAEQDNDQELTFEHQLVKLKVVVVKASDVSQVTGVTLNNVKRKVPITALSESGMTLGTATSAVSGDVDYSSTADTNNSILIGKSETASTIAQTYTYVCVFPAQSWASGTALLTVDADNLSASFAPTAATAFVGGSEYTVTLNVDQAALGIVGLNPLWAGPLAARSAIFFNE